MNGSSKKIYLIRHAESYNNHHDSNVYKYDAHLTNKGLLQSKTISNRLDNINLIVHSKLVRTHLTATDTIIKFPEAAVQMWDVHEFNYLGDDLSISEEKGERVKRKSIYWGEDNLHYSNTQGSETYFEFLVRIEEFVKKVANQNVGNIAIFTHKYFAKGVCWHTLMQKEKTYYSPQKFKNFCDIYMLKPAEIIQCMIFEKNFFWGQSS